MISTYEERLIIFKKWLYIISISENLIAIEFCFESDTKNFTTCSKCNLTLNNWKIKRDLMKAYRRQSSNCVFVQKLNMIFKETSIAISIIALIDSTSTKSASINCIAFSPQTFYLIIIDLYRKQKILLVKIEKNVKTFIISYEKRLINYKNWSHDKLSITDTIAIEFWHKSNTTDIIYSDIIICSECDAIWFEWLNDKNSLQIHLMWNNCFLIKTLNEEFETVISTSSSLFIQSKLQLVASSIFISVSENSNSTSSLSENSNSTFLRSISFCSASTILSLSQSKLQLVASFEFQTEFKFFKFDEFTINFSSTSTISDFESIIKSNAVLVANSTFFFSYDKRLTTFKKWFYTSSTSKTLVQAEFRHTFIMLSLNCITCCRCDLILENWEFHDDSIKEHLRKSSECSKAKKAIEQKIFIVAQEIMKQEIVVVAVETIKFEICVKNINFFNSTMQINF